MVVQDETLEVFVTLPVLPGLEPYACMCPTCRMLLADHALLSTQVREATRRLQVKMNEENAREMTRQERAERMVNDWIVYHYQNPQVWEMIRARVLAAAAAREPVGMNHIWEGIRWESKVRTDRSPEEPGFKNGLQTIYLRMIHALLPENATDGLAMKPSSVDDYMRRSGRVPWLEVEAMRDESAKLR